MTAILGVISWYW